MNHLISVGRNLTIDGKSHFMTGIEHRSFGKQEIFSCRQQIALFLTAFTYLSMHSGSFLNIEQKARNGNLNDIEPLESFFFLFVLFD